MAGIGTFRFLLRYHIFCLRLSLFLSAIILPLAAPRPQPDSPLRSLSLSLSFAQLEDNPLDRHICIYVYVPAQEGSCVQCSNCNWEYKAITIGSLLISVLNIKKNSDISFETIVLQRFVNTNRSDCLPKQFLIQPWVP